MARLPDVTDLIAGYDAKLDPARLARKYGLMRADAFAFFRATCHLFWGRLPDLGRLLQAPPAWCCGDLHLENFGTYTGANGLVYFDINDFDEALLAPCSFDALRCAASIAAAADKLRLEPGEAAGLTRLFVEAYARALARGRAEWIERDQAQGPIGDLVAGLRGSSRERLLERRTQRRGQSRAITIDGEHATEASEGEKARAALLLRRCARVQPEMRARPAGFFDVADVAVRIAGLGSLGMERYIALVAGEGGPDGMRLIDIKRARASCAAAASRLRQPGWSCEAERVAAVQGRMQARPPAFLGQVADRSRSYVIRELQPREDRLDLAGLAGEGGAQLETAIESFARLAAWAHLRGAGRQGAAGAEALAEYGQKEKWRERLLLAATQCAARSRADWQGFCKAFDAGAFRQGSSGGL